MSRSIRRKVPTVQSRVDDGSDVGGGWGSVPEHGCNGLSTGGEHGGRGGDGEMERREEDEEAVETNVMGEGD